MQLTNASFGNNRVLIDIQMPWGCRAADIVTLLEKRRQKGQRIFERESSQASAGQQVAGQAETFEWTQHGYGNLFRLKKLPGDLLHVFASDSFDRGLQFLYGER